MLILCAGMPKAGSAWFFALTNDLLVAAGHPDAQNIREKYHLHDMMKFTECNIQKPDPDKLDRLTQPPVGKHTFAAKTHFPPNPYLLELMAAGKVKTIHIYRDPRDAALSAYEAGIKLRQRGITERFGKLHNISDALHWVVDKIKDSLEWQKISSKTLDTPTIRYEDLLTDPTTQLQRVCDALHLPVNTKTINEIIEKWTPKQLAKRPDQVAESLHFNKGKIGRFRDVMNTKEKELCHRLLGPYLETMGYGDGKGVKKCKNTNRIRH